MPRSPRTILLMRIAGTPNILSQAILADAHGFQEFLLQNLTWMNGRILSHNFHLNDNQLLQHHTRHLRAIQNNLWVAHFPRHRYTYQPMDSLPQLHTEMAACRRCLEAGYDITPPAIFRGQATASVLLIGQAPGVTEVEARRPFNASSGRRLFQWLGQAGWDEDEFRARHYMTAVTKCYPGKGKNGKGDRVPSKAEQKLCRPFLNREIALVNPRLMILVGGLAIKLLFPAKAKLTEIIGTAVYFPPESLTPNPVNFNLKDAQWHKSPNLQKRSGLISSLPPDGRYIIPLPHPSGASLWPNKPENKALTNQAISLLSQLRQTYTL